MKNTTFAVAVVTLAIAAAFTGCTSAPAPQAGNAKPPFSAVHLGRIGVVAFSSASEVTLIMPDSKTEAFRRGIDKIRPVSQQEMCNLAPLANWPMTPVWAAIPIVAPAIGAMAATVEAAHGALVAQSAAALAPAQVELQRAVEGVRLEQRLRHRVYAELSREDPTGIVSVDDTLLRRLEPKLAERAWRQDAQLNPKTLAELHRRNIDTALQIILQAPSLIGRTPFDSSLALSARVRLRVVDTRSGLELHRADLAYRGAARPYPEWAADNAALLHAEFDRCVESLSTGGTTSLIARAARRQLPGVQLAALDPGRF